VALLLDNGAPVGQRNYYGLTALHRASEEGKLSVVRALLAPPPRPPFVLIGHAASFTPY